MSETPDTDHLEVQLGQAATHSHPILWEHSRKLERERDEARRAFVIATDQMVLAQCKLRESNTLAEKAKELVARWDQPSWKDTTPTAGFINALRDAVKVYEEKT
jgi:hypothetical protein